MRTIYIDQENRCHTADHGTRRAVETDFFDGKCDAFVEGFCYEVREHSTAVYAWMPYSQLAQAQQEYERALIQDMQQALSVLGVKADA